MLNVVITISQKRKNENVSTARSLEAQQNRTSSNIYASQSYGSYRKRNIRVKYRSVKCVLTFVKMDREEKFETRH